MPRKTGAKQYPLTAVFEYTDKDGIKRKGKGRTYIIDGQEVDLFTSATLAGMLHRRLRTIYTWEKDFGFPRALYKVTNDFNCNRWYSRKQLNAILTIYEKLGRLRGENREKLRIFVATVRRVFYVLDASESLKDAIIEVTKGNGNVERKAEEGAGAGADQGGVRQHQGAAPQQEREVR